MTENEARPDTPSTPAPAALLRPDALVGWGLSVAVLTAVASLTWWTVVDDAYISARYGEQLALGNGLVYNAGEPPIEGYTNLLWTVQLAVGRALGLPILPLMVGLGYVGAVVSVGAAIALVRTLSGRTDVRTLLAGALLGLSPHLAVTATNGLESSQFLALVLLSLAAHLSLPDGRRGWLVPILGALVATRPDGVAVAGLVVLHDLWRNGRNVLRSWPTVVGTAGSFLAIEGWRLATYGMPFPNTWYAKTAFALSRTFKVNAGYLGPESTLLVATLVVMAVGALLPPWNSRKLLVLAVAGLLGLVPLTVQEWMPGLRLYLPWIAVCWCLLAAGLASLPARVGQAFGTVSVALALAFALTEGDRVRAYDGHHSVPPDNATQRAMEALAPQLPAGAWVATRDAGVAAYFVGMHTNIAELHDRALTQLHPDGKDAQIREYTPTNPEVIVTTLRTADQKDLVYGNDRVVLKRTDVPYRYLGRVKQHYRRHYDVYVRADLGITALPEDVVVSRVGPRPPVDADPPAPVSPAAPADGPTPTDEAGDTRE